MRKQNVLTKTLLAGSDMGINRNARKLTKRPVFEHQSNKGWPGFYDLQTKLPRNFITEIAGTDLWKRQAAAGDYEIPGVKGSVISFDLKPRLTTHVIHRAIRPDLNARFSALG